MVTGMIITFSPVLFGHLLPELREWLPPTSSALIGAPLVITVMIVVSLLTPPPPDAIRRHLVEKVHSL
jgi:cation/acetate symporter